MHGTWPVESCTLELIEMLECSDPAHTGCREEAQARFEGLPRGTKDYVREMRHRKEHAGRADLEWERRKAAGMTAGGDQYRAMLDEALRKYVPK